jgi:hypothetical protein
MLRFSAALFITLICVENSATAQNASVDEAPEAIAPGEPVPRLIGPVTTVPNNTVPIEGSMANDFPLLRLPADNLTFYGARRFGPLYETTRLPPPTDPITGWPLDGVGFPFFWTRGLAFSPVSFGHRSFYRPWYVPYGYGYGWGYRYPFAFRPGYRGYGLYRPWYTYSLYRPWYTYPAPYWSPLYNGLYDSDFGAGVIDVGNVADPAYSGCFFW